MPSVAISSITFPKDVISDDVHVAWRIASSGGLVAIAGPVVHEVRGALTLPSLFRQKVRRASGVIREIFRFLPLVRTMNLPFGAGFVLRSGLMLLGPLLASSALGLLIAAGGWLQGNAIGAILLMGLGVVCDRVSGASSEAPAHGRSDRSASRHSSP